MPVLSKTTVLIACVPSMCSPPLNRMPFSAAFPVPTIIEVGVAKPNAQGQAITNTAIAATKAGSNCPGWTNEIHIINVKIAIPTTIGTKYPEIISASLCIGALEPCASSTTLTMEARAVSLPTFVASTVIAPFLFIVDPITLSFCIFSTGIDSPVNIDSSIEVIPLIILPSTGIFSPGLITK